MNLHCGAVFGSRTQGDLELARQEQEFRVDRRPLPQDFRQRSRVEQLVGRHPGERLGGDIAHAVAGGLDGMHLYRGQLLENVRHLFQFDPVELDILPRGQVTVAAIMLTGDARQGTQLRGRQGAVGNCHT